MMLHLDYIGGGKNTAYHIFLKAISFFNLKFAF